MEKNYKYEMLKEGSFEEVLEKVKRIFKEKGFGLLTEIDIKGLMKEKLGKDIENYSILGFCNPNIAYEALKIEKDIGLFLPCKVIIYKKENKIFISAINPKKIVEVIQNDSLKDFSIEISKKIKNILREV